MNAPHSDRRPAGPRDWKCDYNLDTTAVHIRPRNDHIWHTLDDECPCGPQPQYIDTDTACRWLVIHHALDQRQLQPGGYTPAPGPTNTGDGPDDAVTA